MKVVIEQLQQKQRSQFASILQQYGKQSVKEYSSTLYSHVPASKIDVVLMQAFQTHLDSLYSKKKTEQALRSLQNFPVLQTSTHTTLSEGPTFWATHWLASQGVPQDHLYLIGTFSGIPFSNSAWPGCLNYGAEFSLETIVKSGTKTFDFQQKSQKNRTQDTSEQRISFISGKLRDAPVFQSQIPQVALERYSDLQPMITQVIPPPKESKTFTEWALHSSHCISKQLIPQVEFLYFDLNEVIKEYLKSICIESQHPLHQFLFHSFSESMWNIVDKEHSLFSSLVEIKNKPKQRQVYVRAKRLQSMQIDEEWTPENLYRLLEENRVCPGVFLTFTSLVPFSGIRCLGSFDQIEYLPQFAKIWEEANLFQNDSQITNYNYLTTGRCIDENGISVFPLDQILGKVWSPDPQQTLTQWLTPIIKRLLS